MKKFHSPLHFSTCWFPPEIHCTEKLQEVHRAGSTFSKPGFNGSKNSGFTIFFQFTTKPLKTTQKDLTKISLPNDSGYE